MPSFVMARKSSAEKNVLMRHPGREQVGPGEKVLLVEVWALEVALRMYRREEGGGGGGGGGGGVGGPL